MGLLVSVVCLDDFLHQWVADHVSFVEADEGQSADAGEDFWGDHEAGDVENFPAAQSLLVEGRTGAHGWVPRTQLLRRARI